MADTFPIDTGSLARAELTPTPAIARPDVPLPQLSAEIDARMERLMVAELEYEVHHLDADSAFVLPDCQYVNYLPGPAGGQP